MAVNMTTHYHHYMLATLVRIIRWIILCISVFRRHHCSTEQLL